MMKENDASDIFNDLAKNAYIIFYELDKTCHHDNTSFSSSASEPSEWMDDVKQVDTDTTYKTGVQYSKCNCEKKHYHHHHHRSHLKESCNIM
jgi:hypothetical protein